MLGRCTSAVDIKIKLTAKLPKLKYQHILHIYHPFKTLTVAPFLFPLYLQMLIYNNNLVDSETVTTFISIWSKQYTYRTFKWETNDEDGIRTNACRAKWITCSSQCQVGSNHIHYAFFCLLYSSVIILFGGFMAINVRIHTYFPINVCIIPVTHPVCSYFDLLLMLCRSHCKQ